MSQYDTEALRRLVLEEELAGGRLKGPLEVPGLQPSVGGTPQEHYDQGTAQGQDMSWMQEPGQPLAPPGVTNAAPRPQNFGTLSGGFSHTKLNDPNHQTSKYIVGRTLSQFDPSQGLTPEVLTALNGLGLAEFYGSGDKGGYRNVTDKGRAAGIKDDGTSGDWIKNFSGSGPKTWRYAAPGQAQRDAGGGGGVPIDSDLGLSQIMGGGRGMPTDSGFFQRLMQLLSKEAGISSLGNKKAPQGSMDPAALRRLI